ncbi:MAG: glycosyltransferase family 2 protein [Cycloclasticus sp.]|nr:glycosyltransferase family 2 protein [Cycloclasticus sp.]
MSNRVIFPVIVIVAYNRPKSLKRLLNSIEQAEYPEGVHLIISLEGEASNAVVKLAHEYEPSAITVSVLQRPVRLGLKQHIIMCGDLALEYGAVIILEDDLIVDKYFYQYSVASLKHYEQHDSVAGISLYAPEYNEYAGLPFTPMKNGYSTYPIQMPCSSGQCWSAKHWLGFKRWYKLSTHCTVEETKGLPAAVKAWPESSWKKYYAAYLLQYNLVFINPYQSYTSNCSDPGGMHIPRGSHLHQVDIAHQKRPEPIFVFCPLSKAEVVYDAFYEPCGEMVYRLLGLDRNEVDIDILATKPSEILLNKYILTSRRVINPRKSYPMSFRPIEHNLSYPDSESRGGKLSLVRRKGVELEEGFSYSFDDYSYYFGADLKSMSMFRALVKGAPKLLFARVKYYFQ